MKKILAIMPISIGGRLTTSSIIDGFLQNGFEVVIYDELKNDKFDDFLNDDYSYIVGYGYSPIKLKFENKLKLKCIAYFSDEINLKTAGIGYLEYFKTLWDKDIYAFYWDRELAKKEKLTYMPHFVNLEVYKDFKKPINDVLFMGRFDTPLRLRMFLELNKKLPEVSFCWYAIEKHFTDAILRCENELEKEILKKAYKGFIDNEIDMANKINESKIVYNINAQGISSLNYRSIQTLACKRLLISDVRKELDLFDNIIPTYKNIDDLAQKIRYYLSATDEYKAIVEKSYDFILKNHSSKNCIKKMLELI